MNFSETLVYDHRKFQDLQKLVRQGENLHLEFKRKASHPEKIARELIAFSNTDGGQLLIGVDDDGSIPGVKYPEEELVGLQQVLEKRCRPRISWQETIIPISEKKFVVSVNVSASEKRPHFFVYSPDLKECYVRSDHMSVKASRVVVEIVRRSKKKKDIRFAFGDAEKKLMEYFETQPTITLDEFRKLAGVKRFFAAKKLILLVLANVLRITPTEKGDLYSRI